eukprot:CAMPEP_0198237664 /NCGR_PEP_ID=MMETSP1446-20131203/3454_1 /TAXON_ID=1461542 ORGANISM="Unidentified sp, Strain CCMP2111" /NCGR_SAMPLE_ID=MMETSP1446 /ASSEMBLY_ACC=CAM_ASM_001112 /LENGTH=652 /DNA_ID=CAMNT_0043919873 /DNA_START=266 /DNA_END=2224 /DNA_ORIENTATION=+
MSLKVRLSMNPSRSKDVPASVQMEPVDGDKSQSTQSDAERTERRRSEEEHEHEEPPQQVKKEKEQEEIKQEDQEVGLNGSRDDKELSTFLEDGNQPCSSPAGSTEDSPPPPNSAGKFTEGQIKLLEDAYQADAAPIAQRLRELANASGMTYLQCKSWFQYQRKKRKKHVIEHQAQALKSEIGSIIKQIEGKQKKNVTLEIQNGDLRKRVEELHNYTQEIQTCVVLLQANLSLEKSGSEPGASLPAPGIATEDIVQRLVKFLIEKKDDGSSVENATTTNGLPEGTQAKQLSLVPTSEAVAPQVPLVTLAAAAATGGVTVSAEPAATGPENKDASVGMADQKVDVPEAIVRRTDRQLKEASAMVTHMLKTGAKSSITERTLHHPAAISVRKMVYHDEAANTVVDTLIKSLDNILSSLVFDTEYARDAALKPLLQSFVQAEVTAVRSQTSVKTQLMSKVPLVPVDSRMPSAVCVQSMFCLFGQCYLGFAERSMCFMGGTSLHALVHHAMELLKLDSQSEISQKESQQMDDLKAELKAAENELVTHFEDRWKMSYALTELHHNTSVKPTIQSAAATVVEGSKKRGADGLEKTDTIDGIMSHLVTSASNVFCKGVSRCFDTLSNKLCAKLFVAMHKVRLILRTGDTFQEVHQPSPLG